MHDPTLGNEPSHIVRGALPIRVGNAAMARQTALSVYWGLYALALIALGFWRRSSFARYAGLALLGLTLAKVMLVDLAQVRYFYRVLSLLVIGLLFIVTALAYARLASALRVAPQSADRPPGSETR